MTIATPTSYNAPGTDRSSRRALPPVSATDETLMTVLPAPVAYAGEDMQVCANTTIRFFVGLAIPEIATLTEQSDRTVKRRWQTARMWLAAELGLAGRVHFLGHVTHALRVIADADVYVMSSREEGLGTSVLDAMARGIPVASTSAGGLPEMLHEGARRYAHLPGGHQEAWADAFCNVMRDIYGFIASGRGSGEDKPPAFATFDDGYRAACVVDAILKSHTDGGVWTDVRYE